MVLCANSLDASRIKLLRLSNYFIQRFSSPRFCLLRSYLAFTVLSLQCIQKQEFKSHPTSPLSHCISISSSCTDINKNPSPGESLPLALRDELQHNHPYILLVEGGCYIWLIIASASADASAHIPENRF